MERWERERAADLAAIVDEALPGEGLTEDELVAICWEDVDPTIVVADPAGDGVAVGVVHGAGDRRVGFVQLVAVRAAARRRGLATALVGEVTAWAVDQGATVMRAAGAAPFYVWPGVDVHAIAALCLFESLGYLPVGSAVNMSFPTSHRAPTPAGVELRRAIEEDEVVAGLTFVERHWPIWVAEAGRAVDHGTCHLVLDAASGDVVGFGCHSVNRLGWLGPMGTDPGRRAAGAGSALLSAMATDLMAAGLSTVEVSWVGPVRFYAKAAGATVSRSFRTLSRRVGSTPA